MDVSSVTAITAAPAQSAAAPVTIDAMFGLLLQSVTEADSAALATPSIQSAALALVLPATTPQTGGQQDNTTVTPGPQAPWLSAPITPTAQSATSEPFPTPATNSQQGADVQIEPSVAALPETVAAPVLISAPPKDNVSLPPVAAATPAPDLPVQAPEPQQIPAVPPQTPQSRQQPPTEPPLPAALAPEPVQAPVTTTPQTTSAPQTASAQTGSSQTASAQNGSPQTTAQVSTPPDSALDVADQIATPDPAPATIKPAAPKTKIAAEPQIAKNDDATKPNPIVDVLAGFLLPQIEPITTPANDATADTVDPVASTKNDDQGAPVVAATDQNAVAPVQPMPVTMVQPVPVAVVQPVPVAMVQPAPAPVPTNEQIAPAAIGQAPAPKNDTPADDPATPAVAQKPTTHQQASHQTATDRSDSQPVFVPANDTAPDRKPEIQPQPAADARAPATADSPQPAQANASNPAPHQAPAAIANPAIPPVAPSGLRKLTAGLQVAMQEQETTSSIDKLSLTIATKSIDGLRHFDIRLDPPELGRVQVQLTTDDTGRTQANVVVDKPQTLELLQRDAQNLNRALNNAGLDVSNNGLNFSLREQYRQNDGGVDQGRNRSLSVQAVMQTDATQIHSSLGSYAPNSVRLDIRV